MNEKEIILAKIADVFNENGVLPMGQGNGNFKARLRCAGLNDLYEKYSEYLEPYTYNISNGREYQNNAPKYNVFLGLDSIFSELYLNSREDDLLKLLKELVKSINYNYLKEYDKDLLQEIKRLYNLLGIELKFEWDKIKVTVVTNSNLNIIKEQFSVEKWLNTNYRDVYNSYEAAIDSYTNGHSGACIESCRTTLTSLFTFYQGDGYNWYRGVYNVVEDTEKFTIADLTRAINKITTRDLAEFFEENKEGKLTKTRAIYAIYSMLSDYGTHRGENSKESPTLNDALFMLRLTENILFWVYSINEDK